MRRRLLRIAVVRLSFNPRICKRCDSIASKKIFFMVVSIHASVKDATKDTSSTLFPYKSFNPRICKRCDFPAHIRYKITQCFNPRICKRCDVGKCSLIAKIHVSIHASVKDATVPAGILHLYRPVSIHASVKDATVGCRRY